MSRELAALKKRVGSRIKSRRKLLGMSQEDLAFKAEISTTYLSMIESGERNVSLDVLYRISTSIQIELPALLTL